MLIYSVPGNTVVEHSAHNSHIKDSNPAKGGIVDNHGCALGPNLSNILPRYFTGFLNKLECLSLPSLV